ncbi:hypothetical protein EVJ58_g1509 [Rhodofomes roseus]|uniref:DUF6535 domain-containing protein n=1 Tax=Rhodofomes roseus TaxID=34475 RepID=A0A4Y9YZD9_9APHY|nr:hypothetical protein EVJ58_g1509 [Rhodofomes roseus]
MTLPPAQNTRISERTRRIRLCNGGTKTSAVSVNNHNEATNDAEKRVEDPWSKLAETVWHRSKDDINRWWEEINSLLTFAGLFSAVVTGFAVLCYTVLADSGATADAPILHHYVAALWFASLVCGLASASIAISVNQWLNYMLTPAGLVEFGPRQKLRIWNLRQLTFKKCHVAFIIGIPPVLLQLALALFLIGLVGFLWTLSIIIALPTLILVALLLAFQLAMLVVPAVLAYSPFQSPQAQWLRWVVFRIVHTIARAVHYAISRHPLAVSKPNAEMPVNPRPKGRFGTDTLTVLIFRLEELCKHSSWVANEKHYLDNVLHSGEIDSELFAATFRTAVTKDDKPTLQYIQQCLRDMPLHLACSNAAALWTESDKARLDNSIRCTNTSESTVTNPSVSDTADESRASWHYDTLDKDVTIMMADVLVDVMTRLVHSDPQKLPDHMQPEDVRRQLADMSKKLDILLWLLPAMGGREVYRRILGLLQTSFRAGEHIHLGARYRILDVIWGHVNCFSLKDITGIHTVIKKTHNQEKDYTMKLELITFALHVHVHHHQSTDVGETLTDLDLLLRSMEETDFTRATSRVPSHVPVLIQDLEHQAYSSSQPTRPELLIGIVNTLSNLAHGRKFRLFDRDMLAMKQKDLSDVSHNIHTQFGT